MNDLISSRGTESSLSSLCLAQCLDLFQGRIEDPFTDELGNAISFGDLEFGLCVIEHDNANVPAIVLIDDTS